MLVGSGRLFINLRTAGAPQWHPIDVLRHRGTSEVEKVSSVVNLMCRAPPRCLYHCRSTARVSGKTMDMLGALSYKFSERVTVTKLSRVQPNAARTPRQNKRLSHRNLQPHAYAEPLAPIHSQHPKHWLRAGPSRMQAALRYVFAWKRCTNIQPRASWSSSLLGETRTAGPDFARTLFSSLAMPKLRLE